MVCSWIFSFSLGIHGHNTAGVEVEPKLFKLFLTRNMVTPYLRLQCRQGSRKATCRRCGEEIVDKANARPVMGPDRGSKFALSRKGADFHMVLDYERIYRIFLQRGKANEHESVCVF